MKVMYTGAFRFPDGDAAAFRVLGVARMLLKAEVGIEKIDFVGWESKRTLQYVYDGHSCYPQGDLDRNYKNLFNKAIGFVFKGWNTLKWVIKNGRNYDLIIVYNPPSVFAILLLVWSKLNKKKIILDSTEWYESEHLPGGRFGVCAIENFIRMQFIYKLYSNFICISNYLKKHYCNSNSIILRPVLIDDTYFIQDSVRSDSEVRIFYAGQFGKKDIILPFIESLVEIRKKYGVNISFYLAGYTYEDIKKLGWNDVVFCVLKPMGRICREDVLKMYQSSDFSVLFREHKRYALAGFSTKAVESLSQGCPIIGNMVGDLNFILEDNVDSLYVDAAENADALYKKITYAMRSDIRKQMRLACLKKYNDAFSFNDDLSMGIRVFFEKMD